jgi:putative membrane protein
MLRVGLIVALLATLGCVLLIQPWGALAGLVWVPFAVWHALASFRLTAWARTPVGLVFRSGVMTRKVSVTFYDKMQVITLKETLFDRRHDMASLRVDTAGAGPADHKIDIPYLPREVAREQLEDLFERAQQAAFRV